MMIPGAIAKLLLPFIIMSNSPIDVSGLTPVRVGPVVMQVVGARQGVFRGSLSVPDQPPLGPNRAIAAHSHPSMPLTGFALGTNVRNYQSPPASQSSSDASGFDGLLEAMGQAEQQASPSTPSLTNWGGQSQDITIPTGMPQSQKNAITVIHGLAAIAGNYDPMVPQLIQAWASGESLQVTLINTSVYSYSDESLNQAMQDLHTGQNLPGNTLHYGYLAHLTGARVQGLSLVHPYGHGPVLYLDLSGTEFTDSQGADYKTASSSFVTGARMAPGPVYGRANMPTASQASTYSLSLKLASAYYPASLAAAVCFTAGPSRPGAAPAPAGGFPHLLLKTTDKTDDLHAPLPAGVNQASVDMSYDASAQSLLQAWQTGQRVSLVFTCTNLASHASRTWTIPAAAVHSLVFTGTSRHTLSVDFLFPGLTDSLKPTAIVAPRTRPPAPFGPFHH